jgi:hypothetical protein
MSGELIHVIHRKSQMRQIGLYLHRTAFGKMADLDQLFAGRGFQEDQHSPSRGTVPINLLQTKDITIKRYGAL